MNIRPERENVRFGNCLADAKFFVESAPMALIAYPRRICFVDTRAHHQNILPDILMGPWYIVTALVFSLLLFCSPSYAQEKVYDLDTQQSVVSWKGEKLTGSHHGTLKVNHGKVRFSDEGLTGGTFTLDMTSITNLDIESDQWRAKLEKHLKSDDFFDVSHFPEGTFVITKVHPQDDGYEVVGDLTIKGKTHPISFPATVTKEGDSYHASAKITLDRLKWDIKYNSGKFFDPQKLGDKLIYDEIEIGLELWTKGAQ